MDLHLSGKKAVVTGGTRGIGRAIVERLLKEGAEVAFCARKPGEVERALGELLEQGGRVIASAVDVSQEEAYKEWVRVCGEKLGGIDLFIHNVSAGGGMDEGMWRKNFETDLMGAVRGCEASFPFLEKSKSAAVVLISTTAALENFWAPMPYNALKASLINYSKHLSQAWGNAGIRVNTISPGPISFAGGAWQEIKEKTPEVYESTVSQIPLGRMGSPDEVANIVAFLSSPVASFVTGTNVIADGGFTKGVQY